jgi:hypothetical protein
MKRPARSSPSRALLVGLALLAWSPGPLPALAAGGDGDTSSRSTTAPADPDYTAAVRAIKQQDFPTSIRLLRALCLFSCEEYRDLKKAVEAYERSGGKIRPGASE